MVAAGPAAADHGPSAAGLACSGQFRCGDLAQALVWAGPAAVGFWPVSGTAFGQFPDENSDEEVSELSLLLPLKPFRAV